jgi:hypothetical protein
VQDTVGSTAHDASCEIGTTTDDRKLNAPRAETACAGTKIAAAAVEPRAAIVGRLAG